MSKRIIGAIIMGAVVGMTACGSNGEKTEELRKEAVEKQSETIQNQEEDPTDLYEVESEFATKKTDIEYGERKAITYESKTTGTTRKANVILPVGYSEDQEYPVLYLLHGVGGDQNEWFGGSPDVVVGNLVAKGEAEDMIIVMPNVRARANDAANPSDIYAVSNFRAFDNFINDLRDDLMPYIEKNYSIASGRENAAIAGLSMGGREALYIGLTMPDIFGYVGAFCPAPGVLPYNVESGLFQTSEFKLPDGYESFIMIVAGKSDNIVGTWPSTYDAALTENGTEHIYYETDGGHDFVVWKHGLYNFAKRIFKK